MARTKVQLQPQIRAWCEWHLLNYEKYKKDIASYKLDMIPSGVGNYSFTANGKGGVSRVVEETTLRILADKYVMEMQKIIDTVDFVLDTIPHEDRKLIELCYLSKNSRLTAEGACLKLNISKSTGYRKINNTLAFIAMELGYMPLE